MPKKAEFIKFNTIKEYINDILKMRSSDSAVKKSIKEIDSTIEKVLKEAGKLAKEDKRNTVMNQDIISAIEKPYEVLRWCSSGSVKSHTLRLIGTEIVAPSPKLSVREAL